ncbi:MAG: ATP-binding protein [Cyanobacteria bacterium J06631_9]
MTDPELVWLLSIVSQRSPAERRLLYQEIVKYSWSDETYDYMSERVGYALNTIKQEHAIAIWRMLSEYFETRITKKNLKLTVRTLYRDTYGIAESAGPCPEVPSANAATENSQLTIDPSPDPSPFCDVGQIQSDNHFFNRQEILQDIIYHLKSHWNISLVGEQKIGKSSLLLKICRAAPALLGLNSAQFIYLNMELIHNENILFQQICKAIGIETCRGYDLLEATQNKKYILCIDEIEKMAKFSGDERGELRGLSDGEEMPFTLITASRIPLEKLFPDDAYSPSPFFNIFQTFTVTGFSEATTSAFIKHRLEGCPLQFTDIQIRDLFQESRGHPAKIQQLAHALYRNLLEGTQQP